MRTFRVDLANVDRFKLEAVKTIVTGDPFRRGRPEAERAFLGSRYRDAGRVWSRRGAIYAPSENILLIGKELVPILERLRAAIKAGAQLSDADLELYQFGCAFHLYDTYDAQLGTLIEKEPAPVPFYDDYAKDHQYWFGFPGVEPEWGAAGPLFDRLFQVRRACHYIYGQILGGSMLAAELRAAVWEAIFSASLVDYQLSLVDRMDDISTLVTGPSGSGKEQIARAIGLSGPVPFNTSTRQFAFAHHRRYRALNLAALAPTVVESELFGHRRGAFTGATTDAPGWLEACAALFLDEIAEAPGELQTKLLRVLETRIFQAVGDLEDQFFTARLIAATRRNLVEEMNAGRFRPDLYYRMCAYEIVTPALHDQFQEAPGERRLLVRHLAGRVAGARMADRLTDEVEAWIDREMPGYTWPGNVRQLLQCVRSMAICHRYYPPPMPAADEDLARSFLEGRTPAERMIVQYVTNSVATTGSARETGRRLDMDARTVAKNTDQELLAKLIGRRPR